MKVGRALVYSRLLLQTLYPTWFRWKVHLLLLVLFSLHLYIPHGSDESKSSQKFIAKRSRFISHMVQMKETQN